MSAAAQTPPVSVILLKADGRHEILHRKGLSRPELKKLAAHLAATGKAGFLMEMYGGYFDAGHPQLHLRHQVAVDSPLRIAEMAFGKIRLAGLKR